MTAFDTLAEHHLCGVTECLQAVLTDLSGHLQCYLVTLFREGHRQFDRSCCEPEAEVLVDRASQGLRKPQLQESLFF